VNTSVRERLFLILGGDFNQRQLALSNIKKRLLKQQSLPIDFFTFYAKEIELKTFSEKLLTVSFGQKKVVMFRNFDQLASPVRKFFFKNIKKILKSNYLIFDSDKEYYQLQKDKKFLSDELFSFIIKQATTFRVNSARKYLSIQDFISSLRKNDLKSCLYVVESLFSAGGKADVLGPQIIGILVYRSAGLNGRQRKEYFQYLWEADRELKEKGLDPRLVINTLLVKILTPSFRTAS